MRWRHPYGRQSGTVPGPLFLAFCAVGGAVALVDLLTGGGWHPLYPLLWLVNVPITRTMMVGLWVSDRGVRVRNFWLTHTVAWGDIAAVEVRSFGFLGPTQAIQLVTRDGRVVPVPIRRGRPGPWRRFVTPSRQGTAVTTVVPATDFDQTVRLLAAGAGVRPTQARRGDEPPAEPPRPRRPVPSTIRPPVPRG